MRIPPARSVPAVAGVFCLLGLAGLYLPLVETAGGVGFSVSDLPWLGLVGAVALGALTVLPVVDLVTGRARLTGLLVIPATVGLVVVVGIGFLVLWLADLVAVATELDAGVAVRVGPGAALLALSDIGLLGTSVAALRRCRAARRRETTLRVPPPIGQPSATDPDL